MLSREVFLHLTNASNCLKDGQWLECSLFLRTLNVLLALNVHILKNVNIIFVVIPCIFCVLIGQPQKKGVSLDTKKKQNNCCRSSSRGLTAKILVVLGNKGSKGGLILKEGYSLHVKAKPLIPMINSRYAHPLRNNYLMEPFYSLLQKQTVEKVKFHNQLFLVPKPNQKWGPILNLTT